MVSIWLNEKELEILDNALGTLGDGYWTDEEFTAEECEIIEDEVKKIISKISKYHLRCIKENKSE